MKRWGGRLAALLNAYALAQEHQDQSTELTIQDWDALASLISPYGVPLTEGDGGSQAISLLTDMAHSSTNPGCVMEVVMPSPLRPVVEQKRNEEARVPMENLGPDFSAPLASRTRSHARAT